MTRHFRLPKKFRPVYRYKFVNGKVCLKKKLDEQLLKQRCVVYARVCGGQVIYVGKADSTLGARINAHLRTFPARADAKPYRDYVRGKTVTIYAYRPKPTRLFGLEIPIHVAVEAALIRKFQRPYGDRWFGKRI
jgi:hypothetical protein